MNDSRSMFKSPNYKLPTLSDSNHTDIRESRIWTNLFITTLVLISLFTIYLFMLVYERRPFPLDDLVAHALFSVFYAAAIIVLTKFLLDLPVYSFPLLFIIGTFLYTLSVFILVPLDEWNAFQRFIYVDKTGVLQGLPIVCLAFSSFLIGTYISKLSYKSNLHPRKRSENNKVGSLRLVAIIIYTLSFAIIVFSSLSRSGLYFSYTGGYEEFSIARVQGIMPYAMIASFAWFLPWSCLILIATDDTHRQRNLSIVLVGITILIYLLAGDRLVPTITLLLLIPTRYLQRNPVKLFHIFLVIIIVVTIITSWDVIRKSPIQNWSIQYFQEIVSTETLGIGDELTDNAYSLRTPFGRVFSGLSTSYQTLMGSVRLIPVYESYRYGMDYMRALVVSVPFLPASGLIGLRDQPSFWITSKLSKGDVGLGFLQVAEAYINFGAFGIVILYIFLGWLLTRLWWQLDSAYLNRQLLAYTLIFMMELLNWIRNDSINMGRTLVWGYLIVYVITAINDRITKN